MVISIGKIFCFTFVGLRGGSCEKFSGYLSYPVELGIYRDAIIADCFAVPGSEGPVGESFVKQNRTG